MKIRILAAIAVALAMLGLPGTALADPGHGAIRYASAKGCVKKDGATVPCGTWAAGQPRRQGHAAQGRPVAGGRRERQGGRLRGWRRWPSPATGGRSPTSGRTAGWPSAPCTGASPCCRRTRCRPGPTSTTWLLQLSDDGARLAVVTSRVRLFDTATGNKLGTLPRYQNFIVLSGDGDRRPDQRRRPTSR
ncbi:hypothetical protein [Nonomuraea dietziae]|uniref:hypothetical protein n=1 Tax=Nonomuraea dietziae TaxID=65515 RepID=UPI0031D50EB7